MLRHQLAVAERDRPRARSRLTWPDRACLALLAGTVTGGDAADRHSWHDLALAAQHRPPTVVCGCRARVTPAAWQRIARCGRWCCDWRGRTSRRDTGGSTASSRGPASRWRRPRSGRSSRAPGSTGLRAGMAGLGGVPPVPGAGDPGTGHLHRRPAQRHESLPPCRHRARHPPHRDPRSRRASDPAAGSAAGPEPAHGPGRRRDTGKVHPARPGRQLHHHIRLGVPGCGHQGYPLCGPGAADESGHEHWTGNCRRELPDRNLVWNQRHLIDRAARIRGLLQRPPAPPNPQPGRAAAPATRQRCRPGSVPGPAA